MVMLKKNQEQSQLEVKSAGRLVLLPGIYFVLCSWYNTQSLSCLSKKISEKKKSDVRVLWVVLGVTSMPHKRGAP